MFIAAVFTIAKTWKQPKCPSTDEWIKMWYICIYTDTYIHIHIPTYTVEYYTSIKKNEIMPFAAVCMDLEIITLSKADRERQIS